MTAWRLTMTRLLSLVGLAALLLMVASCGAHLKVTYIGNSSPAVTVEDTTTIASSIPNVTFLSPLTSSRSQVWVLDIIPSGSPSEALALQSVHDGRVKTLGALRFEGLQRTGTAAVLVTGNLIEASLSAGGLADLPSVVAEKAEGGTAWVTSASNGPVEAGHGRRGLLAPEPLCRSPVRPEHRNHRRPERCGSNSIKMPSTTSYCLTISVDKA